MLWGVFWLEAQQILAVVVFSERLGELVDLLSRDVAHAVGNLFEAGNLEALSGLDGLDEGCGLQQGVVAWSRREACGARGRPC